MSDIEYDPKKLREDLNAFIKAIDAPVKHHPSISKEWQVDLPDADKDGRDIVKKLHDPDILDNLEKHGPVYAAIENVWGPRCSDYESNCVCCQAWKEFDDGKSALDSKA